MEVIDQHYLDAVGAHIAGCIAELDAVSERAGELSQLERRGVERLLQLVVESAIGLAKQWCHARRGVTPGDAYLSFAILRAQGVISEDEERQWRKAIGLRNLLALDYLNIDSRVIPGVLQRREYRIAQELFRKVREGQA